MAARTRLTSLPVWAGLALALALGACAGGSRDLAPPSVEVDALTAAELDAANAAFSAALLQGDTEALVAAYAPDGIAHPPAGGVLVTPQSIRPVWSRPVDPDLIGHRLEPTLRRRLGPGLVLEMGLWRSGRRVEGAEVWTSGCYSVIWRRTEAGWRFAYDGWTAANEASWACRPR